MPRWLKQVISYVISFVLYAQFLNWKIALVVLGGIAFHECGHLYAAKFFGMRTKGFYLIPFMGGAALIADKYKKYWHQAVVVLAGPIAGGMLTLVACIVYFITGSVFIGGAAYWMGILNAFNLLPLAMLDGGQILETIVFSISELVGSITITISYVVAAYVLWFINPFLMGVVVLFGTPHILQTWNNYELHRTGFGSFATSRPDKMSMMGISITILCYIVTCLFLLTMIYILQVNSINMSGLFTR